MSEAAKKEGTYEDLYALPENMTGEIIDGELIATPRPSQKHIYTTSRLDKEIGPPYEIGRGGPGGWIILVEPEIGFGKNILVPDLAGWKRERFSVDESHNWIAIAPDWACEVLSPSTARNDRMKKMRIYARHEVAFAWLIEPTLKMLEAYRLEGGRWLLLDIYAENDKVRIEPFQDIEIDLGGLWLE